jgi:NAD(P)H-hydrate epimerase
MLKILNTAQIQSCDRFAIDEIGIPQMVLMENAGTQVVEAMEEFFEEDAPWSVAVCCGKGNNGGDGLVVARHLHNLGFDVNVYLFAEAAKLQGSTATSLALASALGVPITEIPDAAAWEVHYTALEGYDCIVDALFGTGITGGLRGHYGDVVDAINAAGAAVVSVDLPSGLSADSGEVEGPTVDADLTVTFAAAKLCHVLPPAEEYCGELYVVDIGIPEASLEAIDDAVLMLTAEHCADLLVPRASDTHKGTYGRVLVVAGAEGTTGAAALTAEGAIRAGAGLVTVATPESVYPIVAGHLTEALVRPLPSAARGGGIGLAAVDEALELLASVDVLAIGPGVGSDEETAEAVRQIIAGSEVPTVIDADGLNALAGNLEVLSRQEHPRILTPHPGEMARLLGCSTGDVQSQRMASARRLAVETGALVVLKGYRTVLAQPTGPLVLNPTGNPGMASGGTGDVLTGLIAAFLAQSQAPEAAAELGVFVHGAAGDLAADAVGEVSLVAGDILDMLPDVFLSLQEEVEDDEVL